MGMVFGVIVAEIVCRLHPKHLKQVLLLHMRHVHRARGEGPSGESGGPTRQILSPVKIFFFVSPPGMDPQNIFWYHNFNLRLLNIS